VNERGCFVVLEGGEGVGKSTQAQLLHDRLVAGGRRAHLTREPGGTARGTQIRTVLLHDDAPLAERLLVLADRAQHVAEVVRPRVQAGEIVVSDRHAPSTLAYQGMGRGLGVDDVARLSAWATAGFEADVVVVLDLPDHVAEARVAAARDRLEQAGAAFHRTVRDAYRTLAPRFGWVIVDASGSEEEVADRVWDAVVPHLPPRHRP
jgi:dTMP kinase